jgi:hypothetical protein
MRMALRAGVDFIPSRIQPPSSLEEEEHVNEYSLKCVELWN